MTHVGIVLTRVRAEEKMIVRAFRERGVEPEMILDRELVLDPAAPAEPWRQYDVILQRSLSATRGLSVLSLLKDLSVLTINSYETAALCADKWQTALALARGEVPQPAARLAFTPEASLAAIDQLGYPAVLKPVIGSWGRLLAKVNDPEAAEAALEHRHALGSFPYHLHFVQEFIAKPEGRDIRAFVIGGETVAAIHRSSEHWITNTARGGQATHCPVSPDLADICRRASAAVGGGVLAVDLLETNEGLLVNEINHSTEFRNSVEPTGVDIPGRIADYVLEAASDQIDGSGGEE